MVDIGDQVASLEEKVVLISGSSRGIGAETALAFAREHVNVVVTYYEDAIEAEDIATECRKIGAADVLLTQLNILDTSSIEEAVNAVLNRYDGIDILVNNAGVLVSKPLSDQTIEEIEHQVRTNLEGTIKMTKICLPHVKETIINIASGAGITAYADLSVYCATKFGVRGFSQSLAKELPDLSVYAVNPGMTATEMTDYQGVAPSKVAEIVVRTAKGDMNAYTQRDINVWEYM